MNETSTHSVFQTWSETGGIVALRKWIISCFDLCIGEIIPFKVRIVLFVPWLVILLGRTVNPLKIENTMILHSDQGWANIKTNLKSTIFVRGCPEKEIV
jgi:hypothetical protein